MKKRIKRLIPKRFNPLRWRKMAYRDTHGLLNRAWLFDTAALLYEKKKKSWDFILLYIDLRNFRSVNNKYSHSEGNQVLKDFYALLEQKFRANQPAESFKRDRNSHERDVLVVREGGDEFVVFLPLGVCDDTKRSSSTEAIRDRLDCLYVDHKGIRVSARIALETSRPDRAYDSFLDFFHEADRKLTAIHKAEDSLPRPN